MKYWMALLVWSIVTLPVVHAETHKCLFSMGGGEPVEGQGTKKYEAYKDAVERCVDQKVHQLDSSGNVDSDTYAAVIDNCTPRQCEKTN